MSILTGLPSRLPTSVTMSAPPGTTPPAAAIISETLLPTISIGKRPGLATWPRIETWLLLICAVWIVTCGLRTKPPSRSIFSIRACACEIDRPPIVTMPISGKLIWPFSETRASVARSGFW